EALARGGGEVPKPLKQTMQLLARAMTLTSYRI
ncbi:MAG TPA: demethoxyubiquinone hydroxylase family protein, partial [Gammaproteobacteria bacterium]|nr:demethoxyubiquinone hydroxylase family protein [Gammaproteobacteria bacterium]